MAGTPVFGTGDPLSLGADWEVTGQSLGGAGQFARATAVGADGDVVAHNIYDGVSSSVGRISGSITAIYKGAETNYALAIAGFEPGNFVSPFMITGVSIDYGPCASGSREVVTFNVSNTALTADSAIFKPTISTELPTKQEGTGIPNIITKAGADSEATGATYALTCQLGNTLGADGNDIANAGATYGGEETITQSYVGDPGALTPPTGFIVTGKAATAAADKTNQGYDTYTATAVNKVTRE